MGTGIATGAGIRWRLAKFSWISSNAWRMRREMFLLREERFFSGDIGSKKLEINNGDGRRKEGVVRRKLLLKD